MAAAIGAPGRKVPPHAFFDHRRCAPAAARPMQLYARGRCSARRITPFYEFLSTVRLFQGKRGDKPDPDEMDNEATSPQTQRGGGGVGAVREGDQGGKEEELRGTLGGERADSSGCRVRGFPYILPLTRSLLLSSDCDMMIVSWTLGLTRARVCNCRERDLLHRIFTEKRVGVYVGVDPTGPSLHVGHMLPLMVLAWGYVWGLPVHFLVSVPHCLIGCHFFSRPLY